MSFYALTSAGHQGMSSNPSPDDVLKSQSERRGFQHFQRGPADVNLSEKHVWSLVLHKNILSLENLWENDSKSSFFLHQ